MKKYILLIICILPSFSAMADTEFLIQDLPPYGKQPVYLTCQPGIFQEAMIRSGLTATLDVPCVKQFEVTVFPNTNPQTCVANLDSPPGKHLVVKWKNLKQGETCPVGSCCYSPYTPETVTYKCPAHNEITVTESHYDPLLGHEVYNYSGQITTSDPKYNLRANSSGMSGPTVIGPAVSQDNVYTTVFAKTFGLSAMSCYYQTQRSDGHLETMLLRFVNQLATQNCSYANGNPIFSHASCNGSWEDCSVICEK
jgi:hypothetical protein